MRILISIPPFLAAIIAATAEVAPVPPAPKNPGMSSREIALENLLSERESDKALEAVIEAAKKNHISDQAVLEARFLYHVDHREDDAIVLMLPEVLKQRDLFKIEDSAIFSVKEEWLAVVEYVQAIASLKKGDKEAFKLHITEAFWLSPRQASAFAPHIDRLRLEDAMRQVKINFDMKLLPLAGGDAVTFRQLMVDKKAMILHFWSPASRECEASMPDFAITAKALNEKGIAMISILSADSPEILSSARKMIEPLGSNFPGAWLMDSKGKSFAQDLRVQTLPDFVLISSDGGVLFNGAPSDDGLWDALKKIDSQIIRPKAAEPSE
jgi:hypothetical protein